MSQERIVHPPVRLDSAMIEAVVGAVGDCAASSDWLVAAASIESTHTHLLLSYTERDINGAVKWIKDRTTKAIHRSTPHRGPVWCKGKWRSFLFDWDVWAAVVTYIEGHNVRRGVGPQPYPFISDFQP
jgi:REP element-mobilizing transposase RayT